MSTEIGVLFLEGWQATISSSVIEILAWEWNPNVCLADYRNAGCILFKDCIFWIPVNQEVKLSVTPYKKLECHHVVHCYWEWGYPNVSSSNPVGLWALLLCGHVITASIYRPISSFGSHRLRSSPDSDSVRVDTGGGGRLQCHKVPVAKQSHMVDAWKRHHLMCSTKVRLYSFLWPFGQFWGGFKECNVFLSFLEVGCILSLLNSAILWKQWHHYPSMTQHFGVVKYYLWLDQLVVISCHSAYIEAEILHQKRFAVFCPTGEVSRWAVLSYTEHFFLLMICWVIGSCFRTCNSRKAFTFWFNRGLLPSLKSRLVIIILCTCVYVGIIDTISAIVSNIYKAISN